MSYLPHIQKVIEHLWPSREDKADSGIYAILDTARDEVIYAKMVVSDIESVCLYEGEEARQLEDVAPYLIRLHREDVFTEWLFNKGWGNSWGIFLKSSASMEELVRHFRKLLVVQDEEGTVMNFRYYDPRVLRVYLPTCNEGELGYVFGAVERYVIERLEGNEVVEFCFEEGRLLSNIL